MLKRCSRCGKAKFDNDFYVVRLRDGTPRREPKCKECRNAMRAEWSRQNNEQERRTKRAWRRENPERAKAKNDRNRAKNRDKHNKHQREYSRLNREKQNARGAVTYAKKMGRLSPGPCEVCGTNVDVQAHHDDYSRRLDVRWLCRIHHSHEHHGYL